MNGSTYEIKNGVPQGSVLGPILFIIYVNDICNISFDGSIVTYADDTCLLFSYKTWDGVYEKACRGFNQIVNILNNGNVSLNIDKTVFMPLWRPYQRITSPPHVISHRWSRDDAHARTSAGRHVMVRLHCPSFASPMLVNSRHRPFCFIK